MSEHSKTHWKILNRNSPPERLLLDSDNCPIVQIVLHGDDELPVLHWQDLSLDRILTAVNSHAALVEACKKMIAARDSESRSMIYDAIKLAESALQQAGETT